MAEWWDWTGDPGPWQDNEAPAFNWGDYTSGGPGSWYGQEATDWANGPDDTGGGNWLQSILGSLGGLSGILGPALSAAGSLAGGAIGSNAASNAAGLQSQALNRGIDLQTAQWLQQQENLAPYLQAGRQGLSTLQSLAGREAPGIPRPRDTISGSDYALPETTPGWTPQAYEGGVQVPEAQDYRYTPGQGPSAANYRYTPGQVPSAAAQRWTPGQGPRAQDYRYTPGATPDAAQYASGAPRLYRGAKPDTQVSTLTGQQVLDQDPGAAFRQSEARKALEGSAAARGDLLSGGTLQSLQARSQDLASQEYGNAWQRMMARDTEQYGRDWGQYQQRWGEGVTAAELGLRTNAQNFGQAMSAAQLRESVNQQAQQMGWSQAQTEAAFREQMAQQASQQGFAQQMSETQLREQLQQVATQQGWSQAQTEAAFQEQMAQQASSQGFAQALAGQGQAWTQGLQGQQWEQQQRQAYDQSMYDRMMQRSNTQYGRDVSQNMLDYDRQQAAYRQMLAGYMLPWEQASMLANLGGQATGMYGQQGQNATSAIAALLGRTGEAQATGATNQANSWLNALQNIGSSVQGGLQNNALRSALANLNR